MITRAILLAVLAAAIAPRLAHASDALVGDPKAGQQLYTQICSLCHSNLKDTVKIGPPLYGAYMRKAGTYPGFHYSDAVKNSGKTSFNKCMACHSIGEGAKNKVGPELNGLDGRKSGTVDGYNYSDANKNSGITWNEAQFKEYIKDPKAKVPGTKMSFPGLKTDKQINDMIAYLQTLHD